MNDNNIVNADDDVMLPEGWDGESDFFADEPESSTTSDEGQGAPTTEQPGTEAAPTTEPGQAEEGAEQPEPTTAPGAEPDVGPQGQGDAPTTGQAGPAGKLKFTVKVDKDTQDVELDPADLPSVYQKSQITDRAKMRLQEAQNELGQFDALARTLGYQDRQTMLSQARDQFKASETERLKAKGYDEELASFMAEQKLRAGSETPTARQEPPAGGQSGGPRDFVAEMTALRQAFPNAGKDGKLPEEVVNAAAREGKPLIAAYAAWDARQKAAEAERLRKEVEVLRQNQQNATKAPVTGTTGGGDTEQKPLDDFLLGFGE